MASGEEQEETPWRCVGMVRQMSRKRCQHLYAKSGKKDDLVLLCYKDRFYAMEAWCGHLGGPLYQGDIEDYKGRAHLMCPWHGYMFDVETGKSDIGLEQATFETKTEDGELYIKYKTDLALDPFL